MFHVEYSDGATAIVERVVLVESRNRKGDGWTMSWAVQSRPGSKVRFLPESRIKSCRREDSQDPGKPPLPEPWQPHLGRAS